MRRTIDRFGKPFVNDTKVKDGNARSEVARNITDFGDPSVVAEMPPVMAAAIVETEINNENADAVISELVLRTRGIVASTKDDKKAVGQSRDDDKITKKIVKNIYTKDVKASMGESFKGAVLAEKKDDDSDDPIKRWSVKFDGRLRNIGIDDSNTVFNVLQNRLVSDEVLTAGAKSLFYHDNSNCLKAVTLKIKELDTENGIRVTVSKKYYIGDGKLGSEKSSSDVEVTSLGDIQPVEQPRYNSELFFYRDNEYSFVLPTENGELIEKIAELFRLPITEDTKRASDFGAPRCLKITIPNDIINVHFVDYLKSIGRTFEDTQSW